MAILSRQALWRLTPGGRFGLVVRFPGVFFAGAFG